MLVAAKCTQCGAPLEVDPSREAAVCRHCDMPFVTEKAISNYNISQAQISAGVVNVYSAPTAKSDFEIDGNGVLKSYNGSDSNVVIPNTVRSIERAAFSKCKDFLSTVKIPVTVTEIDSLTFSDCKRLTNITLPDSVTKIKEKAFKGCVKLNYIRILSSVTYIAEDAFEGCRGLTVILVGDVSRDVTRVVYGMDNVEVEESYDD
jgi:hypothetical protein